MEELKELQKRQNYDKMRWFINLNQEDIKWLKHTLIRHKKFLKRESLYMYREGKHLCEEEIKEDIEVIKTKDFNWVWIIIISAISFLCVIIIF